MNFVVFSHLRWDFVFQRPQHLMTRCAKTHDVWYCEEPVFDADIARWDIRSDAGVRIAVPHLPPRMDDKENSRLQASMVSDLFHTHNIVDPVLWYYTPMAFDFTSGLKARTVIYDCMDELSAFRGAPPGLRAAEVALIERADLVFTGGQSLFEAKCAQHPSVHCFPSSIDYNFFSSARNSNNEIKTKDQSEIPRPRLGFCGVIDERMDLALVAAIADAKPDWHLVMIGPVVKIKQEDLPQRANIHYLGGKSYRDLPLYMSGWDVALLPFAQNDSTKFISPTKTPEYLAAGLPVVSTPITDVVRPYGDMGFVRIGSDATEFVEAIDLSLKSPRSELELKELDRFLAKNSWDRTWGGMEKLIPQADVAPVVPVKKPAVSSATSRRSYTEATLSPMRKIMLEQE
jgi:UDP-galactopyranose mutase